MRQGAPFYVKILPRPISSSEEAIMGDKIFTAISTIIFLLALGGLVYAILVIYRVLPV